AERAAAPAASRRKARQRRSSFVPVPGTGTWPIELASADLHSEQLRIPEPFAARLALHGERRAERGGAGRAAAEHFPPALRTLVRHLGFELVEPAQRGAAAETERDPVAEHLATLLAQPVGRLAHEPTLAGHNRLEDHEAGTVAARHLHSTATGARDVEDRREVATTCCGE